MTTSDLCLDLAYWRSIQSAFALVLLGGAKQIKNDNWTVYRTASCIRIDIHDKESN